MKLFLLGVFKLITFIVAVGYFGCCLTPYISPEHLSWMAFLALGYPFASGALLIVIFCWLFIKRKTAFLLVVLLLTGFQNLTSVFAFNIFSTNSGNKDAKTLRIMSWNVLGFDNPSAFSDTPNSVRLTMFDYIRDSAPDVVCMQEFAEHKGNGMISNTTELIDLGYKYFYKTNESNSRNANWSFSGGTAIFSKIPIISSGKKMYHDSSAPEHLAHIDINFDDKPIRIFSTHFKSLNLAATPNDGWNKVTLHYNDTFVYTATKAEKLQVFAKEHAIESRIAKAEMNNSPYPVIMTGDLNTVPSSYPYHVVSKGLQDAFLQKGFGLGSTMNDSLPKTLRIDYMFVDNRFRITRFQKDNYRLSDHYPQFVDLQWRR